MPDSPEEFDFPEGVWLTRDDLIEIYRNLALIVQGVHDPFSLNHLAAVGIARTIQEAEERDE